MTSRTSRSLPRRMQAAQLRQYQHQQQRQHHHQLGVVEQQQQQQQQRHVRLPRSADPSPVRTARRLESLNELHGGPLSIPFPPPQLNQFPVSQLNQFPVSQLNQFPASQELLYHDPPHQNVFSPAAMGGGQHPHHHHQVETD